MFLLAGNKRSRRWHKSVWMQCQMDKSTVKTQPKFVDAEETRKLLTRLSPLLSVISIRRRLTELTKAVTFRTGAAVHLLPFTESIKIAESRSHIWNLIYCYCLPMINAEITVRIKLENKYQCIYFIHRVKQL